MSRKAIVLIAGGLVLVLIVAIVQAQDPFRSTRDSADGELTKARKKASGLEERLQAVRRSNEIKDDMVTPAAGEDAPRNMRRPGALERRITGRSPAGPLAAENPVADPGEPSAFVPQPAPDSVGVGSPSTVNEDDASAESLPSVLKRGAPHRSAEGGDFAGPRSNTAPGNFAPIVTPDHMEPARPADAPPSSRRTARAPQASSAGRPPFQGDQGPERRALLSGQSPVLRVETVGPAAIKIGKDAAFTVQVANDGNVEALDVAVTIDIPEWVQATGSEASSGVARRKGSGEGTQLVWEIERLPGRSQEQLNLKLSPQENRPFDLAVDWTCAHSRALAKIAVQEPQLSMQLAGPKEMKFGEAAVYTITLTNPGTGDAENVVVSLLPPSGSARAKQTSRVGTVPAGGQKQLEIELTARDAGTMEVHLAAEADGGLHGEAVASVLVRRAALEVALDGPKLKFAGSPSAYQVRISNTGNAPAEDVVAHVTLPPGAKYLGGIDKAKPSAGGVAWSVGKLAPGAERVVELKCELTAGGDNRLEAKAKGAGDLSGSAEFVTQIEALADLKLSVVEPKGPRPIGDEAVYEVKVANRGNKAARQVNVVVQFSDGVEPTAAEGARADVVPGQVLFHPLPRIDAGEEVTLRITARAEKEGNHVFRTEIKCSDPDSRLVYEGNTRFFAGDTPSRTSTSTSPPAAKRATRTGPEQLR